jgi:hypothetical protein
MKHSMRLIVAMIALPLSAGFVWAEVDFVKDIKPVLEQTCVRCHSGPKAKEGLKLDTKAGLLEGSVNGKVIVAGKAAESKMAHAITLPKSDEKRMPPTGEPLSKAVTDKFQAWINEGAKWPDGLVLKAEEAKEIKLTVEDTGLPITPGEKAAFEKLEKAGVFVMRLAQNTNWLRVDFTHRGKEVKDDELILLKDMPNLLELNLGGMNVTDANLVHIKPLTNLVRLQLHKTKVTDAGLSNLAGMTKLVSLNLYGTEVTDAGIQQLKSLPKLKKLYVWQSKVTEIGAKQLAAALVGIDINRGYELPPEPKKEEPKKEEPKKDAKKDVKKADPKKDEPKKDTKKDEPKKDTKKDEPKKDDTKKDVKKDDAKKDDAKKN